MNQGLDDEDGKKGEANKESFKQLMKRKVFQIYFELMKERNIDSIFASVVMMINFIQIYGLLYNSKVNFPFKDDLYTTIRGLCDLLRVYPLLENEGQTNYYWILAYGFMLLLVAYILQLIYIDYSIKIDKFYFTLPIKLLRYSSSFIFWVLIQPIVEIFISIFQCEDGLHQIDKGIVCWEGIHIFYCILFSFCLLLYIAISLMISFFYNESRPYHTDAFARLDTNFETYITVYRIAVTIIGHFLY